jgi:endonuclease/exonuclease/phosphatase family metal-dependent hydrolase
MAAESGTPPRATLPVVDDAVSDPWCVLSWNVHGSTEPDVDALANAIRTQAPDVVALQEIRSHQADRLARALGTRYTWALKHAPYTRLMRRRAEGMAILTPHLLDAPGHTEVSGGESMRSWRRRIAQWALVGRPDRSMVLIVNLHLSPHAEGVEHRRAEADRVTDIVDRIGGDLPAVVAGDFNDEGDPSVIARLPGIEHEVPAPTNPADAPHQVLDHVLLPPDASDVAVDVPGGSPEWAAISDHLPVTVRFRLP